MSLNQRDIKHFAALQPETRAKLQRALQRRKAGKHESAIEDFSSVLKVSPKCVPALAGRAAAKRVLGDLDGALVDFTAAAELDPKDVNSQALSGLAKLEVGWYRRARADFEAALRLDAANPVAIQGRRTALRFLQNAPLRVLALRGFKRSRMNADFMERRRSAHAVSDSETFWSAAGDCVLYYCNKERRWQCCRAEDFPRVQAGERLRISIAMSQRHLLSDTLLRGWSEWGDSEKTWSFQASAGIMSIGTASQPLRSVTLANFSRKGMNTTYLERRQRSYQVEGRETFWSACEKYFLYWCGKDERWKASLASHFEKVKTGRSSCYMTSPQGADILPPARARGWYEFKDGQWALQKDAGVSKAHPLQLRTVTLRGFNREGLNTSFEERRTADCMVNGREIFVSTDGIHFLFWCTKESRWKATDTRNLSNAKAGKPTSFAGAPQGADLLAATPLLGWHEWAGTKNGWLHRPTAGVATLGTSKNTTVSAAALPGVSSAAASGDTTPRASTRTKDPRKLQPPPKMVVKRRR